MCLHRNDPIIFVVIFKPLRKNRTILGQNMINCLFEPIDNAFQNMWVHNVNMKDIINNVKIIVIRWVMVRLPQCNLNFYNCELHYLYCCHINRFDKHIFNIWQAIDNIQGCQIKEVEIDYIHTFNNIERMKLSLSYHTTKPYTLPTTRNLNSILHHT